MYTKSEGRRFGLASFGEKHMAASDKEKSAVILAGLEEEADSFYVILVVVPHPDRTDCEAEPLLGRDGLEYTVRIAVRYPLHVQ